MSSFLSDSLTGIATDYHDARNRNLIDRWEPLNDWLDDRLTERFDPSCKVNTVRVGARACGFDRKGRLITGVNFASQDPLNLGSHPKILAATQDAAARFGVHSAGSAAMMGLTSLAIKLQDRLAEYLCMDHAVVFQNGGSGLYAVVRTLVQDGDHIILDAHSPSALREIATGATRKVHLARHLSCEAVLERLERIRAQEPDGGILVMVEALSGADSRCTDIARLQDICRLHEATLLVDVGMDLGSIGPRGTGVLGMQNMLGKVDVVVGTFARAFVANGGFVASNHKALRTAMMYGTGVHASCSAISPLQTAVALTALTLIEGEEGEQRRGKLLANARRLRTGLAAQGYEILGEPSAIVPVRLGDAGPARRATASVLYSGAVVNLIEQPIGPRDGARWILQMMADHTNRDLQAFLRLTREARRQVAF